MLKRWGLQIQEYPTTRALPEELANNPEARARDLNAAFADPKVKAIFASIGGNDSHKLLPFLDEETIKRNLKIVMGFSDTSTLLIFCHLQGMLTFHGPSIMAGLAQADNLPERFETELKQMLFEPSDSFDYQAFNQYCDGYPDWAQPENIGTTHPLKPDNGWNWLSGSGTTQGHLIGGCLETLEQLKHTSIWPTDTFWNKKILFLETSENKPSLEQVETALIDYRERGILKQLNGLIIGRARDYSDEEKQALDERILRVIEPINRPELIIVTNFDTGHTDPQFLLPIGGTAELNANQKTVRLIEPWLSP